MKHFARLLIALSLLGCPAVAQIATTSLRGTVVDPSGAVVGGAQVSLLQPSTGFHAEHTTLANGEYSFAQIPPGSYSLKVTASGFASLAKQAELLVNQPATIDFKLSVSAQEEVEVNATAETLNTSDASLGNALNNATIEALPSEGRNVPDLLSLQPGVVYLGRQVNQDQDSRSGAVAGARSDQSNVTLDGVDNNDQTKGYAFTGILRSTLDSVEEFRVTTTSSNADSGRSSGAQVNVVTKSGTNSFHGGLYEYFRNTYFAANDWFNKQAEVASGEPNKPGTLNRNTYGAAIGGPIKTNKLFFFLNYEGQRTQENQQETMTVPTTSMRQGLISYTNAAGTNTTLTPGQFAGMDPHCAANGTCPWGPGVDPNVLTILNQYPAANGFSTGDGLNTGSFTFSAQDPATLNTYIARFDYIPNERQRIFVRGNMMGDRALGVPQFPGQPASTEQVNNSKGFAVGHVWTISNNLINNFRYGYVWEGVSTVGAGNASFVSFSALSSPVSQARTTLQNVPVNDFVDDFTVVKGQHTIEFGGNYRLVHNNSLSNATSYDSASMGIGLMSPAAIADASTPSRIVDLDPSGYGYPTVNSSFTSNYNNTAMDLAGLISYVTNNYNYKVSANGATGSSQPTGALVARNFKANEVEFYVQDAWRARPNLTITYGLRYTLLQTPYEVNGQQIQPNIDIHQWFETRGEQAAQGNSVQPNFSFSPSGQSRGGKPFWPMNKGAFAPRLAIAYAPDGGQGWLGKIFGSAGQSSIRAGFGMYYDHYGEGIVDSFTQYGAFGLTSQVSSPQNIYTVGTAPRFTGLNAIPNVVTPPPSQLSYPVTPSSDVNGSGFAIAYGIDDHLKSPYSFAMDLSFQRELSRGFTFEAVYVGRLGRHLLQQIDLAAPLNLVDKGSGMDYYTAATLLDKQVDLGATTVSPIAYWENMFPAAAQNGASATQNIYTYLFQSERGNEVAIPFLLDVICSVPGLTNPCGTQTQRFWPYQYSSLYAWTSDGTSNYNAGQFTLRHALSHGLQMDFGYTFSKSMDIGSDAERTTSANYSSTFSEIIDAWNPQKNYGPSDFDVRHLITTNWTYLLPVGRGRQFGGGSSRVVDAVIGGWQLSGLVRWTSGLPFSIQDGVGWTTNWDFRSNMVQTGPIKMHRHLNANGAPTAFADPATLQSQISSGYPWRQPYAGEAGSRNNFRGDGFFGIDSSLAKTWNLWKENQLRFAWDVFNSTNSVRFDTNPNNSLDVLSTDATMGVYSRTLTAPRVQQFSLRYSF
jgi:hypothetical protein